MCSLCITKTVQGGAKANTTAGYHHKPGCGGDSEMVQQFCVSAKAKWKGQLMFRPNRA